MDHHNSGSLTRSALAAALRASTHPLADPARRSLEHAEAPATFEVWTQDTQDLLAIYEERLRRTRAGDGPATSGLEEYVQVLRDRNVPTTVGEVGWGAGNTFFVALLSGPKILGLTTVARAVAFIGERVTHLDRGTYQWVSVKDFTIGEGFTDATLIKNTVDHRAYADDYQGAEVDEQDGNLHGPFDLAKIKAADFTAVAPPSAIAEVQAWADQSGRQSEATQASLAAEVFPLLRGADAVYRFPDLGKDAQGQWGWVVGETGFHEFIAIDRGASRLQVIVASDD